MADVKWIKLSTALPDNRKIKQIRRLPDGDTIALMWIFLMCLAGETNENGMVYFTPEIPYTEEMLADQFSMDINTVRLALNTFQRFGMIEVIDDVICLSAWEKWQAVDKLAEMREYNRQAQQKSRAKRKLLQAVNDNVNDMSMTSQRCQGTDKDIDKDKEVDKKSIRADKPPRTRFIPPTVEEVGEYCKERNNTVDAEKFVDFYTAKGWKVGNAGMKDWKAAVRTWEKREGTDNATIRGNRNEYPEIGTCF